MRGKTMKKILITFMIIAVFLISVPSAMAYFTTYARVKGTKPVKLKEVVEFKEEDTSGNKHVVITANADSDPIYVRLRAYSSSEIMSLLKYKYTEGQWTEVDGWYEYYQVLKAGESAVMDIEINKTNIENAQFNVVVVYEYIPAISDGNGGYVKDWDAEWTGGGN